MAGPDEASSGRVAGPQQGSLSHIGCSSEYQRLGWVPADGSDFEAQG